MERRSITLLALQAPVLLTLALSLVPVPVHLGNIAALENVREVLILASVGLGLFSSVNSRHSKILKELIEARIQRLVGQNPDAVQIMRLAYGFNWSWEPEPDDTHLKRSFVAKAFSWFSLLLQVAFFFAVMALAIGIHVGVLYDVYRHPTVSQGFSIFVIVTVVFVDVLTFVTWYSQNGLFPYVTDDWKGVFEKLKKTDPEIYERAHRIAELEYRGKGILRRLFSRPNPARVLQRVYRKAKKLGATAES